MTKAEAADEIRDIIINLVDNEKMHKALQMAIKALEQDPCPDAISRQAAIDAANRADYTGLALEDVKKVTDEVVKELKQLPSAQQELENKIKEIGYTGKEGRIYIGGRLFAVRELAQ